MGLSPSNLVLSSSFVIVSVFSRRTVVGLHLLHSRIESLALPPLSPNWRMLKNRKQCWMANLPRAPDRFGAGLGISNELRVDARVVCSFGRARLEIGVNDNFVGHGVNRVDIINLINVGSGDGNGLDSGYGIRGVQVDVNVVGDDSIERANEDGIDPGLAFGPAIFVGVGLGVEEGVWLGGDGGFDEGIGTFGGGGIKVGPMVGSSVGAGMGTDDGIGLGNEYGIAEKFQVCTEALGNHFGLGNGIEDGIDVVGSLVWAGVGTDDGNRLFSVKGICGGLGISTLVVGCLFGLGDGIV